MAEFRKEPLAPDEQDEQIRKMQAQLEGLTILVQRVLASPDPSTTISQAAVEAKAPMLEPLADERKRILAAWDAEEHIQIVISPTADDDRIRDDARARMRNPELDYLPRTFQVNGVQLSIPVGEMTRVPLSIAALYAYTVNPLKARGIVAPITFDQAERRLGIA